MPIENQLAFVHRLLRETVRTGDTVLDGTAGNGHDTLFLAQCAGENGRVYAFDIQPQAIAATDERLRQHKMRNRVRLIQAGHEHLAEHIREPLAAAVFNFGYLPRGSKHIATQAETSLAAVKSALSLLRTGGLLAAVLYHGHEAGKPETAVLSDFAAALPQEQYRVLRDTFPNQRNCPPVVLAVEKLAEAA